MICPKCYSENVNVTANANPEINQRSILFDLFMIFITGGFWIIWMLIRGKKETTTIKTLAVCQNCGYVWEV